MPTTFKGVLRRWGSSTAVVVPPEVAEGEQVRVGDEVEVTIGRPRTLADLFGALPPGPPYDYLKMKEEDKRIEDESWRRKFGTW